MSSVRGRDGSPPSEAELHVGETPSGLGVAVGLADLRAAGDEVARLAGRLAPDAVALSEAPAWWEAVERLDRLVGSLKVLLARRVAEARAWQRAGYRSAAEQLAALGGTTVTQARSLLEASKQLVDLPEVDGAIRAGRLSPAQTFAVAAGAAADPDAEKSLLATARRSSLAELREESLRVKAAADPDADATHRRIHAERRLSWRTDAEGAFCLSARGTVDDGARITTALEPLIDRFFVEARRRGEPEPREAYAFDALVAATSGTEPGTEAAGGDSTPGVAGSGSSAPTGAGKAPDTPATGQALFADDRDIATANCAEADQTGDTPVGTEPRVPGDPSRPTEESAEIVPGAETAGTRTNGKGQGDGKGSRVDPRFLALLRVDYSALVRGDVAGGEVCEIAGLGPVPATTARELLKEAVVKLVITKGVDVCNVTHLGRGPTAAQRVALAWNSPVCEVPGCSRQRVEIDHTEPWARTHATRLESLDNLCHHHHGLKHHDRWAFTTDGEPRDFVPPTHPRHPEHTGKTPPDGDNGGAGSASIGKREHGDAGTSDRRRTDAERGPP